MKKARTPVPRDLLLRQAPMAGEEQHAMVSLLAAIMLMLLLVDMCSDIFMGTLRQRLGRAGTGLASRYTGTGQAGPGNKDCYMPEGASTGMASRLVPRVTLGRMAGLGLILQTPPRCCCRPAVAAPTRRVIRQDRCPCLLRRRKRRWLRVVPLRAMPAF